MDSIRSSHGFRDNRRTDYLHRRHRPALGEGRSVTSAQLHCTHSRRGNRLPNLILGLPWLSPLQFTASWFP
jgi:hypothetical protein